MCSGPDYYRIQTPTNSIYAFNSCYRRELNTRALMASLIVLANKNLDRVKLGKHDASLIHIILYIFSRRTAGSSSTVLIT
jgi:hypothetical protein